MKTSCWFHRILLGFVALLLLPLWAAAANDPAEMRVAIIVVFDDINDATAIQNWVNEIASLKYNAIAVHARYRGDATYFPNKVNSTYPNNEPRSSAAGSMDVIQEFSTRGHTAGLKVFAYVNCWLTTDGANSDARPNHVVNTHPEWRTYAYNGGNPIVQTTTQDSEGLWLDPAVPEARTYIANLCGDIMMNYDCDGIILDRIRYPQGTIPRSSKDFGYHPTAIANFHAQYGGSGVPNPDDPNWIAFRQNQISASVQEIWNTITGIDAQHILLSYPIGRYSDGHNYSYQKWEDWLTGGYSDGVLPQIYSTSNTTFSTSCDQNKAAYTGTRLLGAATMAYVSGIDVAGQIQILRDKGFAGSSPYRHGSMGALGYFTALQSKWVNVAPWPDMPWKGAAPTASPTPSPSPSPIPGGEVILDNTSATFSGTWSTGTSSTDKYGADYRYATSGTGYTATYNGNLAAGDYEVYCWYPQGTNRSNNAPYTINYNGGSTTIPVNQQAGGGVWNLLGTFNFVAGGGQVVIGTTGANPSVVMADAIRFYAVTVGPTPSPTPSPSPSPTLTPSPSPTPAPQTVYPSSYAVSQGTYSSGTMASLTANDNNYFIVASTTSGTRYATTGFTATGITATAPTQIVLTVISKSSTSNTTQNLSLWNYSTSAWDQKDSITNLGTAEQTRTVTVTTGAANYVSAGSLLVRVSGSKSKNFNLSHEQIKIDVTP